MKYYWKAINPNGRIKTGTWIGIRPLFLRFLCSQNNKDFGIWQYAEDLEALQPLTQLLVDVTLTAAAA